MNSQPRWSSTDDAQSVDAMNAASALVHAAWEHQRAVINTRLIGLWLGIATLELLTISATRFALWRTVAYYAVGIGLAVTVLGAVSCQLRQAVTRIVFAHSPNLDFTERSIMVLRVISTVLLLGELLLIAALARCALILFF